MNSPGKLLAITVAVMLVPAIPFVLWGERFESTARSWISSEPSPLAVAGATTGLLAADIFLPVPSSVLATYAGAQLGWVAGTLCSWLGLTVGNLVGFGLARRWGSPWLAQRISPSDREQLQHWMERTGVGALVATRAVPLLAEASVLLAGVSRMTWGRFIPAVLCSNLGLAVGYAALGSWAEQQAWIPWALAVSAALPLLLTALVRRLLPNTPAN